MALLVQQYKLLAPDHLASGVLNTFAENSVLFRDIAWEQINSLTYKYNVCDELPEVEYRAINEGYAENTADFRQVVEDLVILGGDADVDVMLTHSSSLNDLRAIQTELKAKSVIRQFELDFFKGTGTNKSLKGLDKRVELDEAGTEVKGTFGADAKANLRLMYELVSKVKNPTHIFMGQTMYLDFAMTCHEAGHTLKQTVDEFGKPVEFFGGCKVIVLEDYLLPAGKMYCVSLAKDNVKAVTSSGLQVRDLGEIDTKPVFRTRIELSCAICTTSRRAFAILNTNATTLKARK